MPLADDCLIESTSTDVHCSHRQGEFLQGPTSPRCLDSRSVNWRDRCRIPVLEKTQQAFEHRSDSSVDQDKQRSPASTTSMPRPAQCLTPGPRLTPDT